METYAQWIRHCSKQIQYDNKSQLDVFHTNFLSLEGDFFSSSINELQYLQYLAIIQIKIKILKYKMEGEMDWNNFINFLRILIFYWGGDLSEDIILLLKALIVPIDVTQPSYQKFVVPDLDYSIKWKILDKCIINKQQY